MFVLPQNFVDHRIRRSGDGVRPWLRNLPGLVESLCARWEVTLDDHEPLYGDNSIVFLVQGSHGPCILKIRWQRSAFVGDDSADPGALFDTAATETIALRAWNGKGAVRLVAASPADGALLLERLDVTRSLRNLALLSAAEVAGGLIRRLAVPAPDGLWRLTDLATQIAERAASRQQELSDPVPKRWIDLAVRLARELAAEAGSELIHADLHYGNILAGTREPWLAIDPRPVVGDPEYAVPELMWTRLDDAGSAKDVRALLTVLVKAGGLVPEKAKAWTVVRAVDYWLWGLRAGLTEDPVRCRRLLETLAGDKGRM